MQHSGHVRLEKNGVYPARRRARRTASALLEVAIQPAFQVKCSYTLAVRGMLDGGSVTVSRMRTFTVANEMGRGVVLLLLLRHGA